MTDTEQKPFDKNIKTLGESTMFHMSLGSKELFHSNFLHWISIVNWDAFLKIMHDLAGLEEGEVFWWEKMKCDVEGYKGDYLPENNNIEVRREYNHFDLSIYILDSEKQSKRKNKKEGEEEYDSEGNVMTQRWIPVLILENKMKSIPYEEQLGRYTKDAFDEWRTGKNQDDEFKKAKNKCGKEKRIAWDTKHEINFILLSLIDNNPELGKEVKPIFNYYNKPVDISFKWIHKSYDDFKNSLERTFIYEGFKEGLNKSIVDDYHKFIEALYNLASNCWKIKPKESYRSQIFPWDRKGGENINPSKITEIDEYKKLRIHDIHEKLLYDQLLSELENKLQSERLSYRRFDQKTILSQNAEEPIRIYTNSGYAHGIGLFEVQYVLKLEKEKEEEIFRLIIQVQGDRYCHMLIYNDIVEEDGKEKRVNKNNIMKIWGNNGHTKEKEINTTLANYISIAGSKPRFPWSGDVNWGKYGQNLIYQYVEIPLEVKIEEIIKAMMDDIETIKGWFD